MKKGKLIVIEGTDCSGKETQCKKLVERLKGDGIEIFQTPFPRYDTPTGKIIGGPLLGKPAICESYFGEEAPNVSGEVASLYYAADRLYNIKEIVDNLNNGITVILDRYTTSNMAFQAGKFNEEEKRRDMYKFIEELEYNLLHLPVPDKVIFLHMPYEEACILKSRRDEQPDEVEANEEYLRRAEKTYLELAELYDFITIKCGGNGIIRTIEDINDELYSKVSKIIEERE